MADRTWLHVSFDVGFEGDPIEVADHFAAVLATNPGGMFPDGVRLANLQAEPSSDDSERIAKLLGSGVGAQDDGHGQQQHQDVEHQDYPDVEAIAHVGEVRRIRLQPIAEIAAHWHRLGLLDPIYVRFVERLS